MICIQIGEYLIILHYSEYKNTLNIVNINMYVKYLIFMKYVMGNPVAVAMGRGTAMFLTSCKQPV